MGWRRRHYAIQVFFKDGSKTERVAIDYPIGHRKRRKEGIPVLQRKFADAIATLVSKYHDASTPGGRAHRLVVVAHPMPLPQKSNPKEPS